MIRKPQVKATLPEHVTDEMDKYAEPLSLTRSEYLALIAKKWFAEGCPPVTAEEEKLRQRSSSTRRAS